LTTWVHAGEGAGSNYTFLTSKERDIETGLDYFGARYYGSTQGRFTGADPALIAEKQLANPQDLNRYAYVANNPLKFIDPDGAEKIQIIVNTFIPVRRLPHLSKGEYSKETTGTLVSQVVTVRPKSSRSKQIQPRVLRRRQNIMATAPPRNSTRMAVIRDHRPKALGILLS
jgi:RHS repeat-associated protein